MNPFYTEADSFDILPAEGMDKAMGLGTPTFELKGNSAEGNDIAGFGKGLGRYSALNRDYSALDAGGAPAGSEVMPSMPTLQGNNKQGDKGQGPV